MVGVYENYGNNIAGAEVYPRGEIVNNTVTGGNQVLRLSYFTPPYNTAAQTYATIESGGTAAGATPTLVRIGLWTMAANGDLTLVASTPNDTTLLAAASTDYFKALSVPYAFIGGQRYAAGILVVTGATAPTYSGKFTSTAANRLRTPRLTGSVSGQADLPANIAAGSVSATAAWPYMSFVN